MVILAGDIGGTNARRGPFVGRAEKFAPLRRIDRYLPIEDHGLVGDGTTAALVGRDGAVSWLCVPRFDSPPLFCRIRDAARGGAFTVVPEGTDGVTSILRARNARARDRDARPLSRGAAHRCARSAVRLGSERKGVAASRGELLRVTSVVEGCVRLRIDIVPRGEARAEPKAGRLRCAASPDLSLQLFASVALDRNQGDRLFLLLRWGSGPSSTRLGILRSARSPSTWVAEGSTRPFSRCRSDGSFPQMILA